MAATRDAAPEVRKSVEAEPDDIQMKDAQSADDHSEDDVDADGEPDDEAEGEGSRDLRDMIRELSEYLCNLEEDGQELASGFQRIPNRRVLPDYFEVISHPVAFSTVRGKLLKKQYTAFSEFVRDVGQICHNAQVYNRPSAPIFGAAVRLREVFKGKLQELFSKGLISEDDTKLPDFGELPPVEDSPPPPSDAEEEQDEEDEEEEDDEEDDEDDDDEDDDSDEEGGRRRQGRGRGGRRSTATRQDREEYKDEDTHKKRGRPPTVLTPTEARINSILRGLRKFKGEDGSLLVLPFERLPDKAVVSDYYQTITNPIALDNIKKKAKRKKYQNVDHAMTDIERMFENAKLYNEDNSLVHKAAVELQLQARILAEHEKAKSDDDFRDEDGKLPLAYIDYKGEAWKVGDWVHIRNPNDLGKPIVAQVYRTWQDRDGTRWINACWYYRPEQTVHRFDKHFFDHEVVKTGQYRDHQIDDVLDRCFVMFITRFGRGRPRGFPRDNEVYVCESRYNEEKFTFNKIKTWASCVPDEVRDRDYEMDLFGAPQRMRKRPSPIKHLLREDAKETDDLPKPTWGSPNAPPIVGAVHQRPRESNESPPPDPTPPPQPTAAIPEAAVRQPSMLSQQHIPSPMPGMPGGPPPFPHAVPSPTPHQYQNPMTPHFQPATPAAGMPPMHQTPVPIPQLQHHAAPQIPIQQMHYQQPRYPQATPAFNQAQTPHIQHQQFQNTMPQQHPQGYNQGPLSSRTPMAPTPSAMPNSSNMYNPPRPPEVYTLPDSINEALPSSLRQKFQRDESGRVLFFTSPPLDRAHKGLSPSSAALGHSAKYLAGRKEWLADREKKRKERGEQKAQEANKKITNQDAWKESGESTVAQAASAVDRYFQDLDKDTQRWKHETGLEGWRSSVQS